MIKESGSFRISRFYKDALINNPFQDSVCVDSDKNKRFKTKTKIKCWWQIMCKKKIENLTEWKNFL